MTVSHCHAVYYLKMVSVSVPTPSVNVTVPVSDVTVPVSDVTGSRPSYQSTVDITSLEISDTGFYTCNATASPNGTPFVTASEPRSTTSQVTVGKDPFTC